MKTIQTKYLGATNYKGSRYKATDGDNSITVATEYALNSDGNHARAAKKLKEKLGWSGEMIGGHTKSGMVFVFSEGTRI